MDRQLYDLPINFTSVFRVGYEVYLHSSSLLRSATETTGAESNSELLSKKQVPYNVVGVSENAL